MALEKQTIPLPLTKGIDRSRPDLLLDPDQLADGINTEMLEAGEIVKRPGFAAYSTLAARTPLALIPTNSTTAIAYANNYMTASYLTNAGSAIQVDTSNVGAVKPVIGDLSAKLFDLIGFSSSISSHDIYANPNSGEILLAFASSATTIRAYKFDKSFNIIPFLASPYAEFTGLRLDLNSYQALKCLDGKVIYWNTGSSGLHMVTFDTSGVATNSLIQSSQPVNWDCCDGETGEFILVYETGGNIVTSRRSNSTGASLGSVTTSATNVVRVNVVTRIQTSSAKDVCLSIARSAGNTISLLRYNSSLVLQQTSDGTSGGSTIYGVSGVATSNPSREYVAVEIGDATRTNTWERHVKFYRPSTTTLISYGRQYMRAGVYSKATQLVSGQNPVVMLQFRSEDTYNLQNSYALVQFGNHTDLVPTAGFQAMISYGTAYPYQTLANLARTNGAPMPNICPMTSTKAICALQVRSDSATATSDTSAVYVTRGCLIEADTTFRGSRSVRVNDQTYLAAGGIYNVTGGGLREIGFLTYPDPIAASGATAAFTDAGAGNVGAGTYSYCLVYEFIDDAGNLIESAPSQVSQNTSGASRQWTINYRLPGWISYPQFKVALYRTTAGGTIFYRATSVSYDYASSTPSAPVTLTDNIADATLSTQKILYTTGGVVENIAPPNTQWVSFVRNRLWTYEYGATDIVWFSKEIREGYFPQFSDLLKIAVSRNFGEIMGIAGIDDKVIVFKRNGAYVIVGEGPTETLLGSWSLPTPIMQGIGCINSRSILETPQGVFFQSQEGIYLLGRDLQAVFIGQPLYKEEGTILGVAYDPAENRCFFLSTSNIWVYYATTGVWHKWPVTNPVDIAYIDGNLFLMTTTKILKQTDGIWQDDSVNYEQRILLGQFQFAGIQAYQRVYKLLLSGRQQGAASGNVTVKTYFDGSSTETDTQTIAQSATVSGNKVQIEVRPSRQKCESMQLSISHTANNPGLSLSAVTAEVGGIPGAGRRAATGRAT